jgi:DNA modification methylase
MGSGTTGVSCSNGQRDFIGIELVQEYYKIAKERLT